LYGLYIDESGDEGIYHAAHMPQIIGGSSRFYTLGGIIVKDTHKSLFKVKLDTIISSSFQHMELPHDFKLHYFDLRDQRSPFNKLRREERLRIANDVFDMIKSIDCRLLSVTIDLQKHYTKYSNPFSPRAYGLYLMFERFQYFLRDNNENGEVIYERYNPKIRKNVELLHKHFRLQA
jgi:Protein of unknown function (DUF3800)